MTACSCHTLGPFWYGAGLARVDEVRNFMLLPLFALARGPSRVLPSAVGTQKARLQDIFNTQSWLRSRLPTLMFSLPGMAGRMQGYAGPPSKARTRQQVKTVQTCTDTAIKNITFQDL